MLFEKYENEIENKIKEERASIIKIYDFIGDYIFHYDCGYIKIKNGWKKDIDRCQYCGGEIQDDICQYCGREVIE